MPRYTLEANAVSGAMIEVLFRMAGRALIARNAVATLSAYRHRLMWPHSVSLQWPVAGGVAVHATRVRDHLRGFGKKRA
jgi:hypothetical protein